MSEVWCGVKSGVRCGKDWWCGMGAEGSVVGSGDVAYIGVRYSVVSYGSVVIF